MINQGCSLSVIVLGLVITCFREYEIQNSRYFLVSSDIFISYVFGFVSLSANLFWCQQEDNIPGFQ